MLDQVMLDVTPVIMLYEILHQQNRSRVSPCLFDKVNSHVEVVLIVRTHGWYLGLPRCCYWQSLSAMQETQVRSPGREFSLEEGTAIHSCSCPENPMGGGAWWLIYTGLQRVRHDRGNSTAVPRQPLGTAIVNDNQQ